MDLAFRECIDAGGGASASLAAEGRRLHLVHEVLMSVDASQAAGALGASIGALKAMVALSWPPLIRGACESVLTAAQAVLAAPETTDQARSDAAKSCLLAASALGYEAAQVRQAASGLLTNAALLLEAAALSAGDATRRLDDDMPHDMPSNELEASLNSDGDVELRMVRGSTAALGMVQLLKLAAQDVMTASGLFAASSCSVLGDRATAKDVVSSMWGPEAAAGAGTGAGATLRHAALACDVTLLGECALALGNAAGVALRRGRLSGAWALSLLALRCSPDDFAAASAEAQARLATRADIAGAAARIRRLTAAQTLPRAVSTPWPACCSPRKDVDALRASLAARGPLLESMVLSRARISLWWFEARNRSDARLVARSLLCLHPGSPELLGILGSSAQDQGSLLEADAASARLAAVLAAAVARPDTPVVGSAAGQSVAPKSGRAKGTELCGVATSLSSASTALTLPQSHHASLIATLCDPVPPRPPRVPSSPAPLSAPDGAGALPLRVAYLSADIHFRHPVGPIAQSLMAAGGGGGMLAEAHLRQLPSDLAAHDFAGRMQVRRDGGVGEQLCTTRGGCCADAAPLRSCVTEEDWRSWCHGPGADQMRRNGSALGTACDAASVSVHANAEWEATARAVGATGPDVIVDMQGLSQGCDVELLASLAGTRPEGGGGGGAPAPGPVVVHAVGFWTTAGVRSVHYRASDAQTLPVERFDAPGASWLVESALLMPRSHQPPGRHYSRPAWAELRRPRGLVVAALVSPAKTLRAPAQAWARAVVNAWRAARAAGAAGVCPVSLLVRAWGGSGPRSVVGELAVAHGLPPRCVSGSGRPDGATAYQLMLRGVDVFLDSPAYGSHTTAVDALSQGSLVLAWVGDTPPGRLPASIVRQATLGLGGALVMPSARELDRVLRRLAESPRLVSALRRRVLADLPGGLFDVGAHQAAWGRALRAVKGAQAASQWSVPAVGGGDSCWGPRRLVDSITGANVGCAERRRGGASWHSHGHGAWRPLHVVVDPRAELRREGRAGTTGSA